MKMVQKINPLLSFNKCHVIYNLVDFNKWKPTELTESNKSEKLKKLKKYKSKLSKIEFRNRLYAKEVKKNDSIKVPFGILLDVVSLSLSENENVTKKGFFKNKIDYRKDNFYNDISYKTELDSLNNKIKNKINPYIEHYDVIKEFLVNSKGKKSPDIIKELTLLSANSFNFDELKIENIENVMIKKEVLYLSKCLSMKETIESIKINKVKFFLDKNYMIYYY